MQPSPDTLPVWIAHGVKQYREPGLHPIVRLYYMLDLAELLARWVAAVELGERIRLGGTGAIPDGLADFLRAYLQKPTMGQWIRVAGQLALGAPKSPIDAVFDLGRRFPNEFFGLEIRGGTPTPANSIHALRNAWAHFGAFSEAQAAESLAHHADRVDTMLSAVCDAFAGWSPIQVQGGTAVTLVGFTRRECERPPMSVAPDDGPWLVGGGVGIPLRPIAAFAPFPGNTAGVAQLYQRVDKASLVYAPIGIGATRTGQLTDSLLQGLFATLAPKPPAQADSAAWDDELALARRLSETIEPETRKPVMDVLRAWTDKAAAQCGDRAYLGWVSGPAGIGKSTLLRRLGAERAGADAGGSERVVLHRFRAGEPSGSVVAFLMRLRAALNAWDVLGSPPKSVAIDRATLEADVSARLTRLSGHREAHHRLFVVVDGVDELMREDASFPALIARLARPRTVWLMSGRPDVIAGGQGGILTAATFGPDCVAVPPGGVPGMDQNEVRSMLLVGLDRLALKLVEIEAREHGAGGGNAFVEQVTRNAEGLPIFIDCLLRDLQAGTYDIRTDTVLPASYRAYQEELIRRAGRGSENHDASEILCMIALANAPLTTASIGALLGSEYECSPERTARAQRAITASAQFVEPAGDADALCTFIHGSWRDFIVGSQERQIPASPTFADLVGDYRSTFVKHALAPPSEPPTFSRHMLVHGPGYALAWGRAQHHEQLVDTVTAETWLCQRLSWGTAIERLALVNDLGKLLSKTAGNHSVAGKLLAIQFPLDGENGEATRIRDAWHDTAAAILVDHPMLLEQRMESAPTHPVTLAASAALGTRLATSENASDRERARVHFAHLVGVWFASDSESEVESIGDLLTTAGGALLATGKPQAAKSLLDAMGQVFASPLQAIRHRHRARRVGLLWARLFVTWPAHPDLRSALHTLGRGVFSGPIRLGLRLARRLVGWWAWGSIYAIIEARWGEISKRGQREQSLGDVVSISSGDASSTLAIAAGERLRSVAKTLFLDLQAGMSVEQPADVWPTALKLAIETGSVTERTPSWQLHRALHGSLLYRMNKADPDRFEREYLRPFLDNRPDLLPGAVPSAMPRLVDMLVRARSYAAFDARRSAGIASTVDESAERVLDLHDKLLRAEVKHWPESFLATHNMVGRLNVHQLCAVAFVDRGPASDPLLCTRALLTDYRKQGRLDVLGKGWIDLIYVATWQPQAALFVLGSMVNPAALADPAADRDDGRPARKAAELLVSSEPTDLDCAEAAAAWALAVQSIRIISPPDWAKFRTQWSIGEDAVARIERWASYAGKSTRMIPDGTDRSAFIRQILENARIGQFMNVVIEQSPAVRTTLHRIVDRWIAACKDAKWRVLTESERGALLGYVLSEVISLALELLTRAPSTTAHPRPESTP